MDEFLNTNGLRLLWTKIKGLVLGKTDKVENATSGNFASLDSDGNIEDSGYSSADFVLSSDFSDTPKIVVPSDPQLLNMTDAEIASLKIGDIVIVGGWMGYRVVKRSGDGNGSEILITYVDNTNIGVVRFKKSNGAWAYDIYWSIPLTNINSIPYKANKILVRSTIPQSGMSPNSVYNLGVLQNNTTFTLAAATDNTIANVWHWTFITGSTVPTITWPSDITMWVDGVPTIVADKYYEIKVHNGCATVISADVPQ